MTQKPDCYGVLAELPDAETAVAACRELRAAGFSAWDSFSPYPLPALREAMGLRRSRLPWFVALMGLVGASAGFLLQWWANAVDYPSALSAMPRLSWQAFVPVSFELGVLFAALGCLLGLLHCARLPRYSHDLFRSARFEAVTDDRFFIAIEAVDPRFDQVETPRLLERLGASHVEMIELEQTAGEEGQG
jgi:hypothetical protein